MKRQPGRMQNLNDVYYFTEVIAHGGFAAAGRALRVPKSKLSRRIAELEARLGVRLIERTSRRFRITEIGQSFYEHCRSALTAVERAEAVVAASQSEPRGLVRFSCPTGLVEVVMPGLPDFLRLYPRVSVQIVAIDRPVDLIAERIDVALRVRLKLDTDAALTMRTLAKSRRILLASPAVANALPESGDIAALAALPTLSTSDSLGPAIWRLEGADGEIRSVTHEPRFSCADFTSLREAAIAGLGIALLPDHNCAEALQAGHLVRVFPNWQAPEGLVHLVFTTRTGLPPQVRAWIDHLAVRLRNTAIFTVSL
ncbi:MULTISPECIES: LysR family transcriptional regulator [Rhodomicrobium]|uniref:LysR family transcriptional regulator n=1 Tax=Rhodomicrobium TaxID=1068 RepID=UPI001FD8A47B|nr:MULTISPECIES: LysR family transcriptional regulator [Rhodomicrobium]